MINIPIIEPWMIQIFTFLIMGFVLIKVIHAIGKQLKIDWKTLLDFSNMKHDKLKRKEEKMRAKAEKLANEISLNEKIEKLADEIKQNEKTLSRNGKQ